MKRSRERGGKPAGKHARPPERTASALSSRFAVVGTTIAALLMTLPVASATADPKPSLKQLSDQVQTLHTQIETLTEQFNGQRERLKTAKKSVELAKKTLADSEADLPVLDRKSVV